MNGIEMIECSDRTDGSKLQLATHMIDDSIAKSHVHKLGFVTAGLCVISQ
jgi:hypothetical protein